MKCPECGSEVAAGEQFCGNCGAPVEATEAAPPDREAFGDETVISEAPVIPPPEPEPPLAPVQSDFSPPPAPPAAEGGDKKKTTTIIAIAVAVVVLLCCCCLVALALLLTSQAGQEFLRDLDLAMLPLLTSVV